METERWRKIVELAEAAAELSCDRRAAFLAEACVEDCKLRKEVESLLASDHQSEGFIEEPIVRIAAELIADDQSGSMIGQEVGAYKIVDLLGVGGMGEVYLAEDTRLRRKVALKILPDYFTSDRTRVRRFEQEARAASALNHPNILTVYEIGESAGTQFIATEYVEGRTLREHMQSVEMTLGEVLDVAMQTASALAVAHRAGIVHRDIKPENIMLRPDGYIKVLDFGLSKMSEQQQPANGSAGLERETSTQAGVVMGTPHYMSPEQARGQKVDGRTDIFSLGAVIYEMLTCRKPFEGETTSHVVVAILEKDPLPISEISPGIPVEFESVVHRTLQKDRKARYQTAAELVRDLKQVRQQLDTQGSSTGGQKIIVPPMHYPSSEKVVRQTNDSPRNADAVRRTWKGSIAGGMGRHSRFITFASLTSVAMAAAIYFLPFENVNAINSIAILPFASASPDSNIDYLSDGIAEYLTNRISRLRGLTVVSSRAASRYTGGNLQIAQDARAVGNKLNVQAVVVGEVAQQANRITVHVELIDVRNNRHLWSEQYNGNATDILGVQEEVVKGISGKLRSSLTRIEEAQLSKRYTESTEAYQSYLRGRYFWNKRTEPDLRKAIAFFDEAIGIDPQYSQAYAGLADSYQVLIFHGSLSPSSYCPKARFAAEKAIEIDDTVAEAHTALAYVKFYYDWDWQGAEEQFKQSIRLNPNYATAHQWYGEYLGNMGRIDESLVERKEALRLDPLSPIITSELGISYYEGRNYDRAIEEFRKAAELYPDFSPAHDFLATAYEQSGLYDDAIAECQKAITLTDDSYNFLTLARIKAQSGRRGEAQRLLGEILENSKHRYYSPTLIGMIYAALGDKDKVFGWLENAYQERDWGLAQLKVCPEFDSVRSDPRYADLLKRMNLSQ